MGGAGRRVLVHSTSAYEESEGGVIAGVGALDDTLSLFMVQVRPQGLTFSSRQHVSPVHAPYRCTDCSSAVGCIRIGLP
jgi:hypothetical protein